MSDEECDVKWNRRGFPTRRLRILQKREVANSLFPEIQQVIPTRVQPEFQEVGNLEELVHH